MISRSQVEELISIEEVIDSVENAFRAKALGNVQMPPKSYIYFDNHNGDFRTMPAFIEGGGAGVKIVNVHPDNPSKYDLPSVLATIFLLNPENGFPLAIMDGTTITKMRTGAAAALAAKYLAREDSEIVAMIGAGVQARTQLSALDKVMDIEEVRVEDKIPEKAEEYAEEMSKKLGTEINPVNTTKEAVLGADILVTVTPRTEPLVMDEWISEGMHINAIGADAPEKQELEPSILNRSKIIVDDWEQASHSGEISKPLSEEKISQDDIYAELGEIIAGQKKGRTTEEEVTLFDSTGLAIQDIATASRVYKKAKEREIGENLDFLQYLQKIS